MFSLFLSLLAQAAPLIPGSDPWCQDALKKVRNFNLSALDGDQWLYVAKHYGLRVLFVLVLMFLAWTVSGWAAMGTRSALRRVKFDETLSKFLAKLVRWLILLLAALSCLSKFGIETTSFAAVLGAAGLAVGLAFQGTLSNFVAGAMLLIFRPYKVGDVVNLAGHSGKVYEIGLFTTLVDTFDNRRIIIPNNSVFGEVIENITYHPVRRVEVEVGTAYAADIDATRTALERAIETVPEFVRNPEPAVVLTGLGASSVDWSVRAWARNDDFFSAKQALLRTIKLELDRTGIDIPFPQMDVTVTKRPLAA